MIDYFAVVDIKAGEGTICTDVKAAPALTEGEKACFEKVEADYKNVKEEIATQAGIVHDFEDSRSARVPWLERTGFPSHIAGLSDDEIHLSFLPPSIKELEQKDGSKALKLRILYLSKSSMLPRHIYETHINYAVILRPTGR